jgi:hypothetical protein
MLTHHAQFSEVPMGTKLRPPAAAHHTGTQIQHLAKLRVYGGGPRFIKLGKKVLYDSDDLDTWLEANKHASTSEYADV